MSVFIPARVVRVKPDNSEFLILASDNHITIQDWLREKRDKEEHAIATRLGTMSESASISDVERLTHLIEKRDEYIDLNSWVRNTIEDVSRGRTTGRRIYSENLKIRIQVGEL